MPPCRELLTDVLRLFGDLPMATMGDPDEELSVLGPHVPVFGDIDDVDVIRRTCERIHSAYGA